MGTIAQLLATVLSGLFSWFASFLSRKITVIGITLGAFVAVTAVFIEAIKMAITAIYTSASVPSWIASSIGMFMPSNFAFVVGSIVGAYGARWAYDKALEKIQLINSAV